MQKTKIEWCDYTINPVKGLCPMACSYCYARRMYKRFGWNPEIRFEPETLIGLQAIPSGSMAFIGSTMELFSEEIRPDWLDFIFWSAEKRPDVVCLFLTKQPQNLIKWSPFPDNCWVGITATNQAMYKTAAVYLGLVEAKIKYISFEPLLGRISYPPTYELDSPPKWVNWVIIGAQTGPYKPPKIGWVQEIVEAADKARIPVFLKDNLIPILLEDEPFYRCESDGDWRIRQETPD